MKRVRVGFLSSHNYFDRMAFSGALYYMYKALSARDLEIINLGEPRKPSRWQNLLSRVGKNNSSFKVGSPGYIDWFTKFASQVEKQLKKTPCDVIFAPVANRELSFFETRIPIVYFSDTTFAILKDLYQLKLERQEIEWESKQEFLVISRSSKLVYTSEWAANSAIRDYQAQPAKIEVIPWGANLDEPPLADDVVRKQPTSPCRLLFVGRDWHRKGGDVALQTLISLEKMGVDAELVTVGGVLPAEVNHDKLRVIPYLNKNIPQQRKQLDELFLSSHFFISPTRADCSPLAFGEANAFGLPVLTTDVGGIPTIIQNGKNGYVLPLSATGEDYANLIVKGFSDGTSYERLVRSSREEYDRRLNWNKWAESIHQVIASL